MAATVHLRDFHKGEGVAFTAALKNRDGSVIDSPASQAVTLRIAETEGGSSIVAFSASPQVVLTDELGGVWTFSMAASDLASVTEGAVGYYNIWSELAGQEPVLQLCGQFQLRYAIET
ncbi:MAG: hypothetical protein AAFM92_03280 [Pseudomonadota bacterium]